MAEAEVRKWAHCDKIVKDLYKEKVSSCRRRLGHLKESIRGVNFSVWT